MRDEAGTACVPRFIRKGKQNEKEHRSPRQLGGFEGQIKIAADFDEIPEGFEEYL